MQIILVMAMLGNLAALDFVWINQKYVWAAAEWRLQELLIVGAIICSVD